MYEARFEDVGAEIADVEVEDWEEGDGEDDVEVEEEAVGPGADDGEGGGVY